MNKQKNLNLFTLITLSIFLIAIVVYSAPWAEPTTMPSSYNPPINTSTTPQTKLGALTFPMMYDSDGCNAKGENCPYYINPSGNSVVSGTISVATPTGNEHATTKGYVDGLFGNVEQEVSLSNLVYVYGKNQPCPDGTTMIMKSWISKLCYGSDPNCPSCKTSNAWLKPEDPRPTCSYYAGGRSCGSVVTCQADDYGEAICAKIGDPLYENKHTVNQCETWNGEVVTVEGDKEICRFNATTCPSGWTHYKNWSTTQPETLSYYGNCPCTTGSHNWGDVAREKCSTEYYGGCRLGDDMSCVSPTFNCGNSYYDGSQSYINSGGASCTKMTMCARAIVQQVGCY